MLANAPWLSACILNEMPTIVALICRDVYYYMHTVFMCADV